MKLEGIHHVTCITGDAPANVEFYSDRLGLRLVKKTINFDNHHVYHFYYGDQRGTPGTIWTTFPYSGRGVPVGKKGAGQVADQRVEGCFHRHASNPSPGRPRAIGDGAVLTSTRSRHLSATRSKSLP